MVAVTIYPIRLMDARKLKNAMTDVVAKLLGAVLQLVVRVLS